MALRGNDVIMKTRTGTYYQELKGAWRSVNSALSFGTMLAIVSLIVMPQQYSVTTRVLLIALLIVVYFLIVVYNLSINLHRRIEKTPVKIVRVIRPTNRKSPILLLHDDDRLGHENVVSLFYLDNDYELLLGIGYVYNRQENGLVQVMILDRENGKYLKEIWSRILLNDLAAQSKVIVKASIPFRYYTDRTSEAIENGE